MKKVIVKNKSGKQIDMIVIADPQQWIEDGVKSNKWGQPEQLIIDEYGNYINKDAEYTISIDDYNNESMLELCYANRKAEYPTAEEFMNAFFDGGEDDLNKLQEKRLLIKAKYPKL